MGPADPINFHYFPGLITQTYSQSGDINIGDIVNILETGVPYAETCSSSLKSTSNIIENTESIKFAVDLVNRSPNLLPNVSLGFVTHAVCSSRNIALATSLAFLPRSHRVCNISACIASHFVSSSNSEWLSHDVIGVVGIGSSSTTVPISYLNAVSNLPIIGTTETSNALSNKRDHPYFFRLVPPDMYQVQAVLRFISSNGWSYVSMVYMEGPYGEGAYKDIQRTAEQHGICIASSQMVLHDTDYDQVVSNLLMYPRARVVIMFLAGGQFKFLLQAVRKINATGHFIWVGGDYANTYTGFDGDNDPGIGAFVFELYTAYIDAFYGYLGKQRVSRSSNPWMKENYEYILGCSYDEGTCDPDADIFQSVNYKAHGMYTAPLRTDVVLTYAHAVHNLLSERCPNARGKEARACVTGKLLREYLKKVSFEGYNGHIEFDENQDVKGRYAIGQFVYDYYNYPFLNRTKWKHRTRRNIGLLDVSTNSITYLNEPITWSHLDVLERIVPWTGGSILKQVPESVCSRPCVVGEYTIVKEVSCCWECRRCRNNERLIDRNTNCEVCPSFTWPDLESNYTTCIDIPPTYPKPHETIPMVLISIAIFFLVITIIISICYIVYRNERVIKASSKELSAIQLIAICVGYTTVILFQTRPTDVMCNTIFFLFCMSFALLYSPLFVKTVRIYRIFKSGAKNERPRFISPGSQFAAAISLIAVQVTLCAMTYILYVPSSRRYQPIWTKKLVELSCDLTLPGTASFLGYNIVLVLLCSVFAFMVRKLPDNFNESKFISMCVSMTLLIWLAFIPTYFTADREYIRAFLLSMALLLNHSVALLLLFAQKICAVIVLPSDSGNFSSARS